MPLHPYYQFLVAQLLEKYNADNNHTPNLNQQKFIEKNIGINIDTYRKIFATLRKPAQPTGKENNNFQPKTLNRIALVVHGCQNWEQFTQKYPIPEQAQNIADMLFGQLSKDEKVVIKNSVQKAIESAPFEWAVNVQPEAEETKADLVAINGYYLLFYYTQEKDNFRVLPLSITNGTEITLKRYQDLILHATLRIRGASVSASLYSSKPSSKYFELLFAKPHPNVRDIDDFFVSIMYARTHEIAARHGEGLCLRISEEQFNTFQLQDSFSADELQNLPVTPNAQQIGLLYAFPVATFKFLETQNGLAKYSKHHHDGNYYFYFCRNLEEKEIMKLPVSIENGRVRMKHTYVRQEYRGKWKFKNPVLWIYMETIDLGPNYVDEDFVIQLKIDGLTLSEQKVGKRFYGLYMATRSDGSAPIAGNVICERANFVFADAAGELVSVPTYEDEAVNELQVITIGQPVTKRKVGNK